MTEIESALAASNLVTALSRLPPDVQGISVSIDRILPAPSLVETLSQIAITLVTLGSVALILWILTRPERVTVVK